MQGGRVNLAHGCSCGRQDQPWRISLATVDAARQAAGFRYAAVEQAARAAALAVAQLFGIERVRRLKQGPLVLVYGLWVWAKPAQLFGKLVVPNNAPQSGLAAQYVV